MRIELLIKLQQSQASSKNNFETNEEEILREEYISPELRQKVIDDLRLKEETFWYIKIKGGKLNTKMEFQKIINFLDNTPNQPTKFRTKNKWWLTWNI